MENSAFDTVVIGTYVLIFVIATSLTIFLFSSTITLADKIYEYGKILSNESVIEIQSSADYNTITGAELLTYYYNYKSPDKYGTALAQNYNFTNINLATIQLNKLYTLTYKSVTSGIPEIYVQEY